MSPNSPEFDSRLPRGIIIQTGTTKPSRVAFWAYLWGEEEPAPSDGLTHPWRASP